MDDDMHDLPTGWYQDPERPRQHRYWDGQTWYPPAATQTPVAEYPAATAAP
jgi:hypothetical protein